MPGNDRFIPDNFGGSDFFFEELPLVGSVELVDGVVASAPTVVLLFLTSAILPESLQSLNLVFAFLGVIIGAMMLVLKPSHTGLVQWVKDFKAYIQSPDEDDTISGKVVYKNLNTDTRTADDPEFTELNGVEIEATDTRDWTFISKMYPNYNAIERLDGTMVGLVQMDGLNLDLASGDSYTQKVHGFKQFLNNHIEFPIQIYLPMRPYDPTSQLNLFERRETDDDIQGNPLLEAYIEDRKAWFENALTDLFIREYYIVVPVNQGDVRSDTMADTGTQRDLAKIPYGEEIANFVDMVRGGGSGMMNEEEIKYKQLDYLNDRINRVREGITQSKNQSAKRLSANDYAALLREYWEGTVIREDEREELVREQSFVTNEGDVR